MLITYKITLIVQVRMGGELGKSDDQTTTAWMAKRWEATVRPTIAERFNIKLLKNQWLMRLSAVGQHFNWIWLKNIQQQILRCLDQVIDDVICSICVMLGCSARLKNFHFLSTHLAGQLFQASFCGTIQKVRLWSIFSENICHVYTRYVVEKRINGWVMIGFVLVSIVLSTRKTVHKIFNRMCENRK